MGQFTIQIETDNAAFEDDNLCPEIGRILNHVAKKLSYYDEPDDMKLYDVNGNRVGWVKWEEEDEDEEEE